jgi:uncharacterized protein YjbI with pentapeptide repeats
MANLEYVEILTQGAEVWNEWRKANPKARLDLYSADLNGADLTGVDLTGTDLAFTMDRKTHPRLTSRTLLFSRSRGTFSSAYTRSLLCA